MGVDTADTFSLDNLQASMPVALVSSWFRRMLTSVAVVGVQGLHHSC